MGRTPRNELRIEAIPDRGWRLFGYFNGERVRQRSADLAELEAAKSRMETQLVEQDKKRSAPRLTWLTPQQLREAEGAVTRAAGRWPLSRIVDRGIAALQRNSNEDLVEPHFEAWVAAVGPTLGARWLRDITYRARAFLKQHPKLTFTEFDRELVHAWLMGLKCSGQNRANNRTALSRFCADMVAAGRLEVNPCAGMRIARRKDRTGAPPILSPLQCHALLLACSTDQLCRRLLGWVVECLFVALRPENEAPKAVWPEVDLANKFQRVMGYKRGVKPRHAPLLPTAAAWLRVVKQDRPAAPGLYWVHLRRRAVRLANEWLAARHPGTPPIVWVEDILRHTYASMRAAERVPDYTLAEDMGTSVAMLYGHYRNIRPRREAARFWALTPAVVAPAQRRPAPR